MAPIKKSCFSADLSSPTSQAIKTVEAGEKGTLDYRLFFETPNAADFSPWHSIPLYAKDGFLNFVCEIPRNSRAKFEVATAEKLNPIKQDSKKGKPRSYAIDILWNYGMLPQTWEDPSHVSEDCDGHVGDNDPVDVVEIGNKTACSGDVYAVKPIAAFAMIDEGELDWKIVAISEEDPRCRLVNDVSDMEEHFPGTLDAIREWFRTYKTHDGKPLNEFALGEKAMDREYTMSVVAQTHQFWKDLVANSREEGNKVKLAVGDVFMPSSCFDAQETISEGVEKIKGVLQAVVEHQSHKRHQDELEVEHLVERHDSKRVEILSASN